MTRTAAATLALLAAHATAQHNWTFSLTVDNQYDVYFGTPTATNFHAGGDTHWPSVETYTATNRPATDFVYVATSSDYSGFQGFLGQFTNTTLNQSVPTGSKAWEVFPAGAYLQQINSAWPATWPYLNQPSQSDVDQAIAFATTNNLWVPASSNPAWTNAAHPGPWGNNLPNIPGSAEWIWHDTGNGPNPSPYLGWNHDEFLVFRVAGIAPAPGAAALAALGGLVAARRRR